MKWSDVNNGVLSVVQGKTQKAVWVPIHRDLQTVLSQIERRSVFILTTSKGQPSSLHHGPRDFRPHGAGRWTNPKWPT